MTNILQRIGNNLEKGKEERKKVNEKYWKLSLADRNAYDLIIERAEGGSSTLEIVKGVPYAVVCLGILGLVFKFLLQVDIIESLKGVAFTLIKLWVPLIIIGMLIDYSVSLRVDKLKLKLLKLC